MATYTDQIMVYANGKLVKISASDELVMGGAFTASAFTGDGAGLTNLSSANLAGALPAIDGSALPALSSSALVGALPALDGSALTALSSSALVGALPALDGNALTNLNAGNLSGSYAALNGSAITDLDAGHLASGTVPSGVVSGSYTGITGVGTLTVGAIGSGFTAIADIHLATISSSGKVLNSATSATNLNTADAIVARDGSGNFSAGIITASLNGNASTATSWANPISIGFSGGDVTGSISALDGSGNVSNVDLTIGSGVVDNSMLAGSISDDKLLQIATAGKVADTALSANVPLLNAATNAFTGSMSIQGSLNVTGPIVSSGQQNVIVHDAFLDLSAGNVSGSALNSGFTFNVKKATGFTVETATAFTAGVGPAVSAPSMTISSSLLAAGDIVEVHGTIGGTNDGLYVVAAPPSGSTVTIKGIGGSAPSANVPFVNNQFTTSTGESATVSKVDLAVFAVSNGALTESGAAAIAVGTFCYNYQAAATEASFADSWTSITSVSTPTLQQVYASGNSIVLANGSNLSVSKPVSGTAAIELEANLASKFEVVGADLSLKTSTSGDVVLDAAGIIDAKSKIMLSDSVGFVQSAGVCSDFNLLYIDSNGVAQKISSAMEQTLDCVALEGNAGPGNGDIKVASVVGAKVYVAVSGSAAVGDVLYVSATAGQATATVPTSGRIIKVGKVIGAASGGHYPIIFAPQYIADV